MEINIQEIWVAAYSSGVFLILYLFLLILGKWINDRSTPYSINDEIVNRKNIALASSYFGYTLAISIIFVGALLGPSEGLVTDLIKVSTYSVLGIVLLNVSRGINNRLILSKFHNIKEIIEDQNIGTGVVQSGSYIASALIVAASIHGEGGGPLTALLFFLLCQVSLVIMTYIYNAVTPFDIHEEIETGNIAAGLAFSGTLIAVGIILAKGAAGDFISWQENLLQLARYSLVAFVVLPVFRLILDKLIISGVDLNAEISIKKNSAAGILEFGSTIGFSIVLFFLI